MATKKKEYSASDAQPVVLYAKPNADGQMAEPIIQDGSGAISTYEANHICIDNTTSTILGSNETFTGEWQDCLDYQEVDVSVFADQNSATNGLVFEWSANAVDIGDTDVFSIYANSGTNYTPNPAFRYVRIKYTNGSVAQTKFSLMTILRRKATGGSFHRIDSTLKDDSDARLNITVPKLKTAANTYVSQQATTSGNAKISIEELETVVSDDNKTKLKVSIYSKTGDTTFQSPRIDPYTHTLQFIDYSHHEIHSGSSFTASYKQDVGNGANMDVLVATPNTTKWTHIIYEIDTEFETDFTIYEAPTISNNGTPVSTYNRDRNSSSTASTLVFSSPTVSSTGTTMIRSYHFGSSRSYGGGTRANNEFILKQGTSYLFRATNSTSNDNYIALKLDWYEHTNKTA